MASFVNPKNVPGMIDADAVVARFKRHPQVCYTALWLNEKGFERALASGRIDIIGSLSLTASEKFLKRNRNRATEEDFVAEQNMCRLYKLRGVEVEFLSERRLVATIRAMSNRKMSFPWSVV